MTATPGMPHFRRGPETRPFPPPLAPPPTFLPAPAQELRQQFGTECCNVEPETAGEMWLEFKAAMSGDLKQGGGTPRKAPNPG